MNDRLRVIRDSIERGDDVCVVHHGHAPRPARVYEVLRSAVRVRYADAPGLLHTVLLKDVRRVEEAELVTVTKSPPITARPRVTPPKAEKPVEPPKVEPAKPVETKSPSELDSEDMGAWLDMGKEVSARIEKELGETLVQVSALRDDVAKLNTEIERLENAATILMARKKRIETVLTW